MVKPGKRRFVHLGTGKGLRGRAGFVKGSLEIEENVLNPTPPLETIEASGADAWKADAGGRALEHLLGAGFSRIEPPVLQPAAPFLDMSGEEIRGRLYLTSDASGAELCLRPEYTIPVCLAHLASPRPGAEAQYAYLGPVFRARPGQSGEMIQTGLESYGRDDIEAADAEVLGLALEAAEAAGSGPLAVRIGDARVFDGVLGALGLPDLWLRRVRRGLSQGRPLETVVNGGRGSNSQSGVLAALERADHAGAKALVEDLLAIAGIVPVGGRTAGEIADRFLEQAAARSDPGVSVEQQAVLRRFLAISGDPDAASAQLRRLAADAGLRLAAALDSFDQRVGFLAAPQSRPVLGGGRYDGLARRMGASGDLPAVGAAIWVERLPLTGEPR